MANVNVPDVAPARFVNVVPPFALTCHCTAGVGVPVAAAVNDAFAGATMVMLAGFVVITGAELTVSPAVLDVTLLTELANTAAYTVPFCEAVVVKLKVVEVAPATATKLVPPFVLTCHCTVGVGVPVAVAVNVAVAPAATVTLAGCRLIAGAVFVGSFVLFLLVTPQPDKNTTALSASMPSNLRVADEPTNTAWVNPICLKFCVTLSTDTSTADGFMTVFTLSIWLRDSITR